MMNKEEYNSWTEFKKSTSNSLIENEIRLITRLHAKYFNHSYYKPCTCSSKTYNLWIKDLNNLYKQGFED